MHQYIRSQIDQSADAFRFGHPITTYRRVLSPSQKRSEYGSILMYVLLIMFFPCYLLGYAIIGHQNLIVLIISIAFFVAFFLFTLIFASVLFFRTAISWYVLFYSEGLISAQGRKITVIRWDQVLAIQQKLFLKQAFLITNYLLQYTLYMSDNTQFTLTNTFLNLDTAELLNPRERDWSKCMRQKDSEAALLYAQHLAAWRQETELIHAMENEVVVRLFPEMVATYQAGRTIAFGQMQISREGISNGGLVIPWRELDRITLYNELGNEAKDDSLPNTVPYIDSHTLIEHLEWWQDNIIPQHTMLIFEKGKDISHWSLKVSEIPNAFLFMAIVDYAIYQQMHHE